MADQTRHTASSPATLRSSGAREQAALRAALAAALAGRGSLVLIGGEAGIGKSTLEEWLLDDATDRGALALVGRCYDLSETPPYGPWAEALERAPAGDDLPALPGAMLPPGRGGAALADQDAIVRRVRDYCAALAARQPVVVLLDDLHWADPASLDLLRAVARDLAGLPLLLVVTYRADEVGGGHPLATLLPLLVREARAARLDLRPLDGAAIAALVASRYALAPADHIRLVGYLTGRTEGNALFLGELLRTLEGEGALRPGTREVGGDGWVVGDLAGVPVPTLLGQVIAGRLRRLPPETQQLLPLAAVIGQAVPLTLWAAVAGTGEEALLDAIDAAVAAHLLAEAADGRSVRFAHALIREALYGDLPPAHRRRAHLAAGEVLAATAGPDPDAVADHFQRAGDARAAEWLERAGARAQAAYAYLTAIERYEAALALLEAQGAGAGVRSWLLLRLAVTRRYASMARALVHAEEAARLAGAADDPLLIGMSTFLVGQVHCTIGDSIRGIAEMTAGLDALDALPPEAQVPPGVDAPLDPALRRGTVAEWLAGVGRYADAHVGLGLAYAGLGQPERAHAALARAREHLRAVGNQQEVAFCAMSALRVALAYRADQPAELHLLAAEA